MIHVCEEGWINSIRIVLNFIGFRINYNSWFRINYNSSCLWVSCCSCCYCCVVCLRMSSHVGVSIYGRLPAFACEFGRVWICLFVFVCVCLSVCLFVYFCLWACFGSSFCTRSVHLFNLACGSKLVSPGRPANRPPVITMKNYRFAAVFYHL